MLRLERLRADHAHDLLAFEQENRAYFARFVPDRGDEYFAEFASRHHALLVEQSSGMCHFHVVKDDEQLVGRVNLVDVQDGSAELGYRIGERAAGRGVASAAVKAACLLAVGAYGLLRLTAATTLDNTASMTVLGRNGFVALGSTTLGGLRGLSYGCDLVADLERTCEGYGVTRPSPYT